MLKPINFQRFDTLYKTERRIDTFRPIVNPSDTMYCLDAPEIIPAGSTFAEIPTFVNRGEE